MIFLLNQAKIISKWIFESGNYDVINKPDEIKEFDSEGNNDIKEASNQISRNNSIENYLMNIRPLTSSFNCSKLEEINQKSKSPDPDMNKTINRSKFIMNMTSFTPQLDEGFHSKSSKLMNDEAINNSSSIKVKSPQNIQLRNERTKTEIQKFKMIEAFNPQFPTLSRMFDKTPVKLRNLKLGQKRRHRNMNNSVDFSIKVHSSLSK